MQKVILNSSPLIFLAKLEKLEIVRKLFNGAIVPQAVFEETVVQGKSV